MSNYTNILSIESNKKELVKVELFLQQYFIKRKLPEVLFNKVLLVVSEAVINSIEHGNKNDVTKKVTIRLSCYHDSLFITVSDEGDGFNYNRIEDPIAIENRKREYGRGIFLMKTISNHINFLNSGKCVEIKINLV